MRIQHNILAMNSYRNYSNNVSSLSSNLEKLSSGYKINRAGDDAAGLAISEKMRAQIKGLDAAEKNVADGISLVKTGEGAMQEIQDMLSRMKYLATQSANGTYDDDVDRANLQKEVDALKTEIDRIADSSNFNGINLLDGSLSGKSQVDNVAMDMTKAYAGKYESGGVIATKDLSSLGVNDIGKTLDYTVTWQDGVGGEVKTTTVSLTFQGDGSGKTDTTTIANNYFTDVNGKHYNLDATSKGLTQSDVQSALTASLKADSEFSSKFAVATGTATTTAIQFEAVTAGTSGAIIKGISVSENTSMALEDIFDTATNNTIMHQPAVTQEAYDSQQRFNVTSLKTAKSTMSMDEINAKIFTLDGHKFLLNADLNDDQIKALGGDVTIIKVDDAKATAAASDAASIAAQVQRVTGYTTKGYESDVSGSDYKAGDVVFQDKVLTLNGNELTLQIGDTADSYNQMGVKIDDMHSTALGLDDVDISTIEGATSAIETIKNAINSVSMTRGTLGAVQNRLEHTANNLSVMNENISDAESTIRDTDIAEEMTSYTKNNILVQSAQAMLAQANSVPQGVLQLLQ
jgi:flagellin